LVFAIYILTTGALPFAENTDSYEPAVDTIELNLELERHERLISLIEGRDITINGFTTDGCSGGLSAGWEILAVEFPEFAARHGALPPWQECCVIHDRQYHSGGAETHSASESFKRRKQADLDLKYCVMETGLLRSAVLQEMYHLTEQQVTDVYTAISELMYRAVRVGGLPCTEQPWRWGYGWPACNQLN
jgi:hypothetical protein